jgi:hypothetical protein
MVGAPYINVLLDINLLPIGPGDAIEVSNLGPLWIGHALAIFISKHRPWYTV